MTMRPLALALAVLMANAGPAPTSFAASPIAIKLIDGRLTLHAAEVPLRDVLERLAELTDVVVRLDDPADEPVTVDLLNVSVDDAFRRLLRHHSAVLTYAAISGPLVAVKVGRLAIRADSGTVDEPQLFPADPAPPIAEMEPPASEAIQAHGAEVVPTDPSAPEPVDAGTIAVAQASNAVDSVEEEVRALPGSEALNMSRFLHRLNDPEPSVRLTALQWLMTRPEARLPALATALKDSDAGVQTAAAQLILDQGVSDDTMQEVSAAAATTDQAGIVRMLHRLLPP